MAPKPEDFGKDNNGYNFVALYTADLRNISGELSKAERQKTFALVTITDNRRARIEYMRGKSHVSCDCDCLYGANVYKEDKFAVPMWPTWPKSMNIDMIAFVQKDDVLNVWCFDRNKKIMRCTYELKTVPWSEAAKDLLESPEFEALAAYKQMCKECDALNARIAELEEALDHAIEPDAIEPPADEVVEVGGIVVAEVFRAEPPALPEPTVVIEPIEVPGATHAAAFYVPDGCTVTISKVGNAWLEGPSAVTKANADKLKANGWKWARQRKQWWRKAA